jgi:LysM repeat protein
MRKGIAIVFLLGALQATAQTITPEAYIELYKDMAIREMKRMGVPASITLAQGILETESGNSPLVKKSNNHFGIKCKSSWTANGVSHDDDAPGECFRQYASAEESYRDHSNFLRGNSRYAFLFKLDVKDYKGWAHGLKKAGYATNPAYPQILIRNIEKYNLQQYTLAGADEVPQFNSGQYQDDPEDKTVAALDKPSENPVANTVQAGVENGFSDAYRKDGKKVVDARKGTSLLKIAEAHNIRLVKLLEYNSLPDGLLQQDQVVYLEPKPQGMGKQATAVASKQVIHTVQAKEGLYSIARKYGVTVQQLKDWNKLAVDGLSIGQQLIVSN